MIFSTRARSSFRETDKGSPLTNLRQALAGLAEEEELEDADWDDESYTGTGGSPIGPKTLLG
jgi:hypothetical protein